MDFFERFSERERDRLSAIASTVRLARGDLLLRRGERGGDLFRVAEGELEVIDNRTQPAVIIDVLGRGSVVGEMAFLDESTRSADVRAADGAVCQKWERAALLRLLEADPAFGTAFYRVIAQLITERARAAQTAAMSGALTATPGRRGTDQAEAVAHELGEGLKARLMESEPVIRRDRALARRDILTALHNFSEACAERLPRLSEEDGAAAGELLARDLHPYIIRSHLGELALDRPAGHAGDPTALAHLHANRPEGDGPLGELLDEWLLSLPTARGLRERTALLAELVLERIPHDGALRMLLLNVGSGAMLGHLAPHLGRVRGELVCVDDSKECLATASRVLTDRSRELRVRLVQDELGRVCLGRARVPHPTVQVLVLDGLVDYVPERVAASLLRWAVDHVAPGGHLLLTSLVESADAPLWRHLIAWPTVRHADASLLGLLVGLGLDEPHAYAAGGAGRVIVARRATTPGVRA